MLIAAALALTSGFTDGTGQIWLDEVQCRGSEVSLFACPANPLGAHNCVHNEDAGVRCSGSLPCTPSGAIRLQGGTDSQGRVEICNNNVWGTVCGDRWDNTDAAVVCKQLGFPTNGEDETSQVLFTFGVINWLGPRVNIAGPFALI
jgi:hypothetical protein